MAENGWEATVVPTDAKTGTIKITASTPQEGGTKQIAILTYLNYDVVIPEEAQNWLSYAESRAAMRKEA